MKAHLDSSGCLTVVSENSTEAYALHKWSDDYWSSDNKRNDKAILLIEGESLEEKTDAVQRQKETA